MNRAPASQPKTHAPTNLPAAAASMVGAAFLFAVMGVTVKLAARSLPNAQIVFLRSLLSFALLAPWFVRPNAPALRTRHVGGHLLRGFFGMAAMYCFFFTIGRLGLAEALLLNYSLPLFIPLVERAWFKVPVNRRLGPPLLLGLCGLLLILKPKAGLFQPAALVGVCSALLAATAQVGVRELTRTEPISSIVFYFGLVSTVLSLGPALAVWHPVSASLWLVLIALGASGTFAQLAMTRAYSQAPAAEVGPFIYMSVVFAGLLDWLIFARTPDLSAAAGALLVVVAGIAALRVG